MCLVCQVDRVAVLCCSGTFGECSVLIACHKQMVYIVAHSLGSIHSADRLR